MLLEAMLAGLPVVATSVSAVPEVVADGTTGILVPEGDVVGVAARRSNCYSTTASERKRSALPAANVR